MIVSERSLSAGVPSLDILLVEDDAHIAATLARLLRGEGHHLTVAHDGEQAMQILDARFFDLLICDVRLPGPDGLTIFRRINRELPTTPVILMSAYGSIPEAVQAMREGTIHYLVKPFASEELIAAVREAANRRVLRRAGAEQPGAEQDPLDAILGDSPVMESL